MASSTRRFRQGAGRLCLDFIRTLRHRGTDAAVEELAGPAALVAWVRQFGPCEAGGPGAVRLEEARELREAIHELIQAARDGRRPGQGARGSVNRVAAHAVPVPSLDAAGRLRWHADDPVTAVLAQVARDALDLVTSPAVARIRECAGPRCGALFIDSSRPGTRRWCSMNTCGNRAKKDTLRARP
jgi:predicted RNA-binding Zn ribbon-like protein